MRKQDGSPGRLPRELQRLEGMVNRAQAQDLRRQEQINQQKESIDRLLLKLHRVNAIVTDDEQWMWDNIEFVRDSLRDALEG